MSLPIATSSLNLGGSVGDHNLSEALDEVRILFEIDNSLIWKRDEPIGLILGCELLIFYLFFNAYHYLDAKYQGYLDICQKVNTMTWPDELRGRGLKKPNNTELIKIFVSTTQYYDYFKKYFAKVIDRGYTNMMAWLARADNAISDRDLWGFTAATYTFKDLDKWLEVAGGVVAQQSDQDSVDSLKKGKTRKLDSDSDGGKKKKQKLDREKKKKKSSAR